MDIWLTDIVKSTMKKVSKSLFNNQKHQEDNIQKVVKQVSEHFNPNFLTNLIDTKQYKLIAPVSEAFGRVYSKFETNKPEYINSFNKYLKAIKEAVETNFEVDNNYIDKIQDTISEVKKITSNEPMYDNLIETLIDEEEELEEQPAYAGSRIDYDKPSLDAIGSGTGDKFHGWGLYYAKDKDVADNYRINSSDRTYFLQIGNDIYKPESDIWKIYNEYKIFHAKNKKWTLNAFISDKKHILNNLSYLKNKPDDSHYDYYKTEENNLKIFKFLKKNENNIKEIKPKGQIYQVELPEDEYLLDEQKTFAEQSDFVKEKMVDLILNETLKETNASKEKRNEVAKAIEKWTGGHFYQHFAVDLKNDKLASQLLEKYGIKGITYDGGLDGHCYVIFNPDDVVVVDKLIKEQIAYAGTREDYDTPSLEKIGSGEGNQAHGWGLYYAKWKQTAKNYYDTFKRQTGTYYNYDNQWLVKIIQDGINEEFMNEETLDIIIRAYKKAKTPFELKTLLTNKLTNYVKKLKNKYDAEEKRKVLLAIDFIKTLDDNTFNQVKPQIHQVEIPDDKYFLDEDNEEQSEYVWKRLIKLYNTKLLPKETVKRFKKYNIEPVSGTGKDIYEFISDSVGGSKKASQLLDKFGIKGIKYNGKQDGQCYVVFNADSVKVVDKLIKESKELTEAYITDQKGNLIYYTSSPDIMMTIIKNKFPKGARVFYDRIKKLYVFSDVFNLIHVQMLNSIIMNTNLYSTEDWNKQYFNEKEQSWEEGYLKEQYLRANCIMFIIVPDDNFAEYTQGDGYTRGWFVKIDDMYAVCRNNEYHACRDEVPMFNDVRWSWTPTDYYLAKKEGLTESIEKLEGSHNTPIYVSNSVYEITNLIKSGNLGQGIRICYDKEKNLFMWGDVYDYTHIDIFAYVCKMGYYPESFTVKKRLTNLTQEGYNYFNFHISQIKITRSMWADEDGYNMFNCFQVGKFMCYWRSEFAGDDSMDIRGTQFYDILSIDSPTMIGESKVQDLKEQVAYHGSITKNIKYFASEKIRRTDYGHGFYFTDSQEMAYRYSDNSKGKGSIYKCEIPDDEYLLDLNNEIKNQSEYVIKALVSLISEFNSVDEETLKEKGVATGDDIYTSLMNKYNLTFGGKEIMTEKLYKAGIKGLKYLDDDHDCHCFVIFNSKDIEILGEQDNIEEQVAYSGSPVDFDKHSNDFIKSGTGLMEYGWGLYFTADADEAKNYKNQALGRSQAYYNGELITQYNDMMVGGKPARELPEWSWNLENLLIKVYRNGKNFKKYLDETFEITFEKIRNTTKGTEEYQNLFKELEDINEQMKLAKNITFGKGVVFKVEIPDDEYLMLADEEPSGQTPTVYKATYSLVKDKIITQRDWAQEGLQMYWALAEKLWLTDHKNNLGAKSEDYKRASMKLRELGVKGIKFVSPFDDKTINYCIFSADDVKILDRDLTEQVNESVTDFNVNLQKAADLYIKFKLETYNCLEPDDAEYITFGIQETHKDLIQKAMEETSASNEADLCWKINDCKNLGKYSKELVNAYALQIVETEYNYIRTSFEESPYIYRAIASDKELNEFIKDLQEFGTGNCWADSIGYARQYYGEEGMKYTYILKGVVSDDNIDWIKTLALNAEDESEQEIRLLNDKPIKVIQIFEDNSNTDEYVDLDLNTGSKYGYDHYQKYDNLNESIYHATMLKNGDMFEVHQNPTKKEFWDLLNRSEAKDLRGILGINEPILYVWDSYYGTHKQIFDSIIGKDWKESDYVGCWFRKNDMGVFGFSKFTSDIKEKYYGKEPEKPMSKDKLDKIIADDDLGLLNEDLEGLNRIAGFYWFDNGHFQLLKRKPEGVEKLDPEDNEFDYYHLDDDGLEEDNKARFGIQRMDNKIVCYIQAETKQKCLLAKKAIDKKFSDILINKYELEWYNQETKRYEYEYLDEAYVQHTTIDPKYNIEYNTDYIEFEPEMRFLDDYDVEWEVEAVKGENVFLRSKNNQVQVMTADDLNLEIDMEKWRCIWDERFYTKSDFERATGQKFPENNTAR